MKLLAFSFILIAGILAGLTYSEMKGPKGTGPFSSFKRKVQPNKDPRDPNRIFVSAKFDPTHGIPAIEYDVKYDGLSLVNVGFGYHIWLDKKVGPDSAMQWVADQAAWLVNTKIVSDSIATIHNIKPM